MQLQKSCSLKTTLSKLSIPQLNKLSIEVDKEFSNNNINQKRYNIWKKLIRKETRSKNQKRNIKQKPVKGIILIKNR